ncbi:hypothetical protein [Streptomyces sp. NPDC052042]|uniref:hypothetical protein n=1 Tax=Streptomyces sp. NPDC052042 TaxID=3365683 RepID=UPI0037CFD705
MIQHMNLVFQAGGLEVGEFAFLMACCNHTDDRGNVIAKMQQLADEAHLPLSTARAKKSKLIKRGLLARGERYSPKNNAQLADLVRVNLDLLASMKRPRVDYGPTLVEELTFATPQENPSSDPPLKSSGGGAESQRGGRSDSAGAPLDPSGAGALNPSTLLLPSSIPSSLSGLGDPSGDGSEPGEEREAAAPELSGADQVADAYEAAAGRRLLTSTRSGLRAQAVQLLAAGRPVEWVAARAAEMPANGWTDLIKHCERSRVPLPGQAGPARAGAGASGVEQQATLEQVAALRARLAGRGSGL